MLVWVEHMLGIVISVVGVLSLLKFRSSEQAREHGQIPNQGIYQIVRHPKHLSILSILFGAFMIAKSFDNLILLIISLSIIHLSVKKEEKQLLELYGKEYVEYIERVRWKVVPKIY